MWVLGAGRWSSTRAAGALNHCGITPELVVSKSILIMCVRDMCMGLVFLPQQTSGGQRTTLWRWFSPPFTWVLGAELRPSDLDSKHLYWRRHLAGFVCLFVCLLLPVSCCTDEAVLESDSRTGHGTSVSIYPVIPTGQVPSNGNPKRMKPWQWELKQKEKELRGTNDRPPN